MIINPSFLFPDWTFNRWEYIGRIGRDLERYPFYYTRCPCVFENFKVYVKDPEAPVPMPKQSEMIAVRPERYTHEDGTGVLIFTGICPECHTVAWTCDSFEWAGWMTDLQATIMFCNAVPINHEVSDTARVVAVKKSTLIRFDEKGKRQEVR